MIRITTTLVSIAATITSLVTTSTPFLIHEAPPASATNYSSFPLRTGYGVAIGELAFAPQTIPGRYGVNYYTDPQSDYTYLSMHGATSVRIPFLWERLQPALNKRLNQKYLALLRQSVHRAKAAHLNVVLDMHNYGTRMISGREQPLGSKAVPLSSFANVWHRIAYRFRNENISGFDLMNEAGTLARRVGYPAGPLGNTLTEGVQSAISAIRTVDTRTWILVPIEGFQAAQNFRLYYGPNPKPWWNDPSGRSAISVHYYLDKDHTGAYVAPWQLSDRTRISTDLLPVLRWSKSAHVPVYFGEIGVPSRALGGQNPGDVGRWDEDFYRTVTLIHKYGGYVSQWAAGSHYLSPTSTEPVNAATGKIDYSLTPIQLRILEASIQG